MRSFDIRQYVTKVAFLSSVCIKDIAKTLEKRGEREKALVMKVSTNLSY